MSKLALSDSFEYLCYGSTAIIIVFIQAYLKTYINNTSRMGVKKSGQRWYGISQTLAQR